MDGRRNLRDPRPKLLMVYADSVHAANWSRYMRRQGWDVHLSPSGENAQHLAETLAPAAVVLDAETPSWQICAQQLQDHVAATIVIVATSDSAEPQRVHSGRATAFVNRADGPQALAQQLMTSCV